SNGRRFTASTWLGLGGHTQAVAKALYLCTLCPEVEGPLLFLGERDGLLLCLLRLLGGVRVGCDPYCADVERFAQILATHYDAHTRLASSFGFNIGPEDARVIRRITCKDFRARVANHAHLACSVFHGSEIAQLRKMHCKTDSLVHYERWIFQKE